MIKIETLSAIGYEYAVKGARNSYDSHSKSDSGYVNDNFYLGKEDKALLKKLVLAGDSHAKCMRMVMVWADINAPLYWWKQFDTYHFVTRCSESTMHTLMEKQLKYEDFSYDIGDIIIDALNMSIQFGDFEDVNGLLPQSYNQKSTVCLNYQTLRTMYFQRKGHKLKEWHDFCDWVETLPYAKDLIICEKLKPKEKAESVAMICNGNETQIENVNGTINIDMR